MVISLPAKVNPNQKAFHSDLKTNSVYMTNRVSHEDRADTYPCKNLLTGPRTFDMLLIKLITSIILFTIVNNYFESN